MLPPVLVVPALSKALRYSSATDLRCSSVMVWVVTAMVVLLGQRAAVRAGCSACAAVAARWAKAMIGPRVAPPAQYACADAEATQLPTPYSPGTGRPVLSRTWPSGLV